MGFRRLLFVCLLLAAVAPQAMADCYNTFDVEPAAGHLLNFGFEKVNVALIITNGHVISFHEFPDEYDVYVDGKLVATVPSLTGISQIHDLCGPQFNPATSMSSAWTPSLRAAWTTASSQLPAFGQSNNRVTTGDFNGDGVDDSAGVTPSSIVVTLNAADGSTISTTTYPVPGMSTSILSTDVDGDGILDLVATQTDPSGQGNVVVLFGNGDGTFGTPSKYPAGQFGFFVAAGDFNGDGAMDLAVTNAASQIGAATTVSVLIGKGDGTFASPVAYTVGSFPATIVAADFDGDGKLDLAALDGEVGVRNYTNEVWVLRGKGDGTFLPAVATPTGTGDGYLSFADLNHDGRADLIIADEMANSMVVMFANSDGSFQPPTKYVSTAQPVSIAALPLQDGTTSFLSDDNDGGGMYFAYADSNGTVQMPQIQTLGTGPAAIAAADLNGDRQPDLVVTDPAAHNVYVKLATGSGSFGAPTTYSLGTQPGALALADVNNDGHPDAIIADASGLDLLPGSGSGTFGPVRTFSAGGPLSSVAVADFNDDGKPDVVSANPAMGGVSVFLGNGDLTFQGASTILLPAGSVPLNVVTGDFSGNGEIDLAVAFALSDPTQPGGIALFAGKGDGTFQAPAVIALPGAVLQQPVGSASSAALVAGDFNGDGTLDLATVISGGTPNRVAVLLGNGDGTFQTPVFTNTFSFPPMMVTADLDGDGKVDLVLADCCGLAEASYFLGNNDGTFGPERKFPSGPNPSALVAADLNGDGTPDMAVVGQIQTPDQGTLVVMFNHFGSTSTAAATTTTADAVAATFSPGSQNVTLSAAVSSNSTPVNGGTVTFTLLNSTVSANVVDGTATASFTIPAGTAAGSYAIQAAYAPASGFAASSGTGQLTISKATPILNWPTPAGIVSGTALSSTQLNATATIAGAFAYTPASGTILPAGNNQTLSVLFTPSDTTDYNTATATVAIDVTASGTEYTFTWSANPVVGGTVTPVSGSLFTPGADISVTASANTCYVFSSWSGDLSGSTNPSPLTMSASKAVIANFASTARTNVTSQMHTTLSGFRYNRISGAYLQGLVVLNTGAAITGPIYVALDSLTAGTTPIGASGQTQCALPSNSPYLLLSNTGIGAGQSVTLTLQFSSQTGPPFVYTPRYLAGSGAQ